MADGNTSNLHSMSTSQSSSVLEPLGTTVDDVPALIDVVARQRGLYEELKTLADQQASFIAQGDTEKLLSVLSARQTLVDELILLNQRVAPMREAWSSISALVDDDQRDHLNGMLDQVRDLMRGIMEQDERDRGQLEQAMATVSREITATTRAGNAINAYRSNQPRAAKYTDRNA